MDLAIDFGTSFGKIGFFEDGVLARKETGVSAEGISGGFAGVQISNVIVSSVSVPPASLLDALTFSGSGIILNEKTPVPIRSDYATPSTLGTDRLAAVVGAYSRYPGRDVLVIDAGTCITYDLLSKEGVYKGGSISPGIGIKFKALHNYTRNLPLMERTDEVDLTGTTTGSSIQSGVILGTIAEMREISRMYRNKLPHLQLVICGGDAEFYSKALEDEVDYAPDLVLMGLKTILDYNV